jgi:hypothetical protein
MAVCSNAAMLVVFGQCRAAAWVRNCLKLLPLVFGRLRALARAGMRKDSGMVRTQLRSMGWVLAAVLSVGAGAPLWAQDDGGAAAPSQGADDQQHGVARISVMDGQVSVRRADADWVAGVINAPLLADDRVSTGPNSRAEVQFDAANLIRLGGTAEIRISALEAGRLQLELSHGTVTYRVLRASATNAEVDTPNISVKPTRLGVYRISVTDSGETELTVRAGDVEVFSPRGSQWVNAGQTMVARGSTADPEFQIVAATAPDGWDAWSDNRDRLLLESHSAQRVPQGVYGSEDLDNHGDWVYDADYGNVWQPRVDPGWAPYQLGQWENLDWYGWTWVSADPWGWAPYHYGRWFNRTGYGWRWYPGVFGVRHYWSPAMVGFFGFGGGVGFGVGFGFGNIGWVPLAPYEVFHPWWGRGYNRGGGYGNRFGSVAGVNIRNAYRNARVANGVTGLSVHDFQNRSASNIVRPTAAQFASAGMIRGAVPLAAGGAASGFSNRAASYAPRSTARSTTFFHAPQTASGAAGRLNSPRAASAGNSTGWSRFGTPGGGGRAGLQGTRPSSPSSGYQRFGEPGSGYRGSPYSGNGGPRYTAPGQQRSGAPTYSAPHYGGSAPSYSSPRYSGNGGGGGHSSGSGSGGHSSGGGGGHSSGGSGGHSSGGGTSRR